MLSASEYIKFIIIYVLIDLIWLLGAKKLHNQQVRMIQNSDLKLNPVGAVGFYTVAPLGYFIFVKKLAKNKTEAFKYGCLMGLLMYSAFDFTNLAIFKNYQLKYATLDMLWGTIAYGTICSIMF